MSNIIFFVLFLTMVSDFWGLTQNEFESTRKALSYPYFFRISLSFSIISLLGFQLTERWITSGYPPFSNLYESLLFLTWSLSFGNFCFLILGKAELKKTIFGFFNKSLENRGRESLSFSTKLKSLQLGEIQAQVNSRIYEKPVGELTFSIVNLLTSPCALFIYTAATWLLPNEMHEIRPLVPALKSNWLLMHVRIILLSYAALLIGSLFSIAYLASLSFIEGQRKSESKEKTEENKEISTHIQNIESSELLEKFDQLSAQSLSFAFPMLTLGILSGAVWANDAWGSYWSWDPKETWALITWFIYAAYLHTRISKGWRGKRSAYLATFGGISVWICYLGVNIAAKGLHSYGWVLGS